MAHSFHFPSLDSLKFPWFWIYFSFHIHLLLSYVFLKSVYFYWRWFSLKKSYHNTCHLSGRIIMKIDLYYDLINYFVTTLHLIDLLFRWSALGCQDFVVVNVAALNPVIHVSQCTCTQAVSGQCYVLHPSAALPHLHLEPHHYSANIYWALTLY